MYMTGSILCCAVLLLEGLLLAPALADSPAATGPAPVDPSAPTFKGDPNDPNNPFKKLHEEFLETAKADSVDVLFLGDSITAHWRDKGLDIWNKCYVPQHAANFGIGGDQTQHVLWRIENGELDGFHLKVVVLMIGINTLDRNPSEARRLPAASLRSSKRSCANCRKQKCCYWEFLSPRPSEENQPSPFSRRIKAINAIIATLDDGKSVRYLDMGEKFLNPDGTVLRELLYDFGHPSEKGYQVWADAMQPLLDEMKK